MKTQVIIAADFVDPSGVRSFCFTLCRKRTEPGKSGLESIACLNFTDDMVTRRRFIPELEWRFPALVRLARIYMNRSIPVQFV